MRPALLFTFPTRRIDKKSLTIQIIISTVSTLIVTFFISPILSLVWKVVVAVGGAVHQGYVDRIYARAATPDLNYAGNLTLLAVVAFGALTVLIPIFAVRVEIYPSTVTRLERLHHFSVICLRVTVLVLLLVLFVSLSLSVESQG